MTQLCMNAVIASIIATQFGEVLVCIFFEWGGGGGAPLFPASSQIEG